METCYMCDSEKTSMEHVPPKCIFPEIKDSANGRDYRKNLIKVPSCDIHNSSKSKEDEFFLMYMAVTLTTSEASLVHQNTKLRRILDKKPHVWVSLLEKSKPVTYIDESGFEHQTCMLHLDPERVSSQFDHIARGIYFHHFNEKWLGVVRVFHLGGLVTDNQNLNKENFDIARKLSPLLLVAEKYGENKDVFFYQVFPDASKTLIYAVFFEQIKVLFFYE